MFNIYKNLNFEYTVFVKFEETWHPQFNFS